VNKKLIPAALAVAAALTSGAFVTKLAADNHHHRDHNQRFQFKAGTLVVTRTKYVGYPSLITTTGTPTALPPGCVPGPIPITLLNGTTTSFTMPTGSSGCGSAVADGTFPTVFNNDAGDGSFGITSPIFLDDITTDGHRIDTLRIPSDQIVTSFSSKSELALNLSTDGKSVTFLGYRGGPGYLTGPNLFDVSDSNTPGVIDPTNPVVSQYYRSVAEVDADGHLMITEGNAYSGDNGRAVAKGGSLYYMAGNDNNGNLSKTQLTDVPTGTQIGVYLVSSTGAELLVPGQTPPVPPNINKIGNFSITQVIDPATPGKDYPTADKAGKDNNFRGLTIFNNTLYVTKGSGSNGINTVYQVGDAGVLPSGTTAELAALPITILPGFPTTLASAGTTAIYPFGIWFADANTLYVADEGDACTANGAAPCTDILATGTPEEIGASMYAHAANQTTAGLQKWVFSSGTWSLAYTIQAGLKLGVAQTIPHYPTGINAGTGLPWAPATDGLRNLTGRVNEDGTVTIWAVTSTVSGNGDEGADPDQLVKVTDNLKATAPATSGWLDKFETIRAAKAGQLFRGVAFAPSEGDCDDDHDKGHDDHH
jgi:hypothetical protein